MAKRYLGYGYTNAQGVAKLEYDSEGNALTHSYTGVGAGKIDIVAESGTLQSETYSILDATFLDIATTGNKNTNWTNSGSRLQITTDSTGTLLEKNSAGWNIYYCNGSETQYPFVKPACIEFDVVSCTGEFRFQVYGGDGTQRYQIILPTTATNYHVEIEIGVTHLIVTVNGVTETYTSSTYVNTNFQIDFASNVDGSSVKYKNFKVYPI